MVVSKLDEKKHIDMEVGCKCRYVRSDTGYFMLHCHDYYEIFLVLKGDVCHLINSHKQILKEGQLLFVRDFDVHDYVKAEGGYFEFINLAFTKEVFADLCKYLGNGFRYEGLLSAEMPPTVYLSKAKCEQLFFRLTELNQGANKDIVRAKLKILILDIFTQYFFDFSESATEIPVWLEITYEKMKKPQNFIAGIERMYEISGKSREHLSRSLKTHYGVSPSEMITDLRLEYSANLLLTSNLSVTDICFESGFENLSWFYKQFTHKYGETPVGYKKSMLAGK